MNESYTPSDVLLMRRLQSLSTDFNFKHFDIWNDQLERLRRDDHRYAFSTPALFAHLRDVNYEVRRGNTQRSTAQLDLHLIAAHRLADYTNAKTGEALERSMVLSPYLYAIKRRIDEDYDVRGNVPGIYMLIIASDFQLLSEDQQPVEDEFLHYILSYSLVLNHYYC